MSSMPVAKDLRRRSSEFYHKSYLYILRSLLTCLVFGQAAAPIAANSATLAGGAPGIFNVTSGGAASYTIPIELPRGSGDLTPSLALVYNSQSGEGAAGYGWTLAGLTAVTRCPKTIDADGVTRAVQLVASDDYCLGGQRLRLASGTYGGTATYTTGLQDFSLIKSFGFSNVSGGPGYFTVQTKDGLTYEYGKPVNATIWAQGANSNVVLAWALDKVSDANGNYYTITYQNNDTTTGDYWPLSIQYTANTAAGTTPLHTVSFTWTPRSDATVQTRFVQGTLTSRTQLLSEITVSYNGASTYTYSLAYQNDPQNGRNQLKSVQQCDAQGDCFPATRIAWQNGAAGWNGDLPTNVSVIDAAHAEAAHVVDVNGDGFADLLYPGQTDWMVIFNIGYSSTAVNTGIPVGNYQWALTSDTNGDGRMDIMVPGTDGKWHLYQATGNTSGTTFNEVQTGLSDTGTDSVTNNPIYEGNAALADYSGRGLADLVYSDGTNVYVAPNNGATSSPKFSAGQTAGALGNFSDDIIQRQGIFVDMPLDFDGSGRQGRLGFKSVTYSSPCQPADQPGCVPNSTTTYSWSALLPAQSGYGYTNAGTLSCWDDTMVPMPIDADGDGLTDLVYACAATNVFNIELSTGVGFITVSSSVPYSSKDSVLVDYYGDGRQEAIVPNGSGWSMIRVNYDPASTSFVPVVTSTSAPLPADYVQGTLKIGSVSGDGLSDLVYAVSSGGAYYWDYNLHLSPQHGVADVVTSITDGLGNTYSPQYQVMDSAFSYTENSGAAYPVQDIKAAIPLVWYYTASDGIGGTYQMSYSYSGARMEVLGLGFLGFSSRSVTDSRNTVTSSATAITTTVTDTYNQAFPYIGTLASETVTQSNGNVLRSVSNTYASSPASCTPAAPCFPYLSQSVNKVNDAGTGLVIKKVTTQDTFGDGYGDLTDQLVTVTDKTTGQSTSGQTFSTETASTYADSASATYCISAPLTVSVTRTNAAGSSLTRETDNNPSGYPFDTTYCRPTAVVESDSADSQALTTAFQYDDYGNLSQVTVSGTGLSARTNSTVYVDDGEYPGTINRVVNPNLTLTTTETWNPALGVETSVTDPNNQTTNFGYDGFGRRISSVTPDGVTTNWSYARCGCITNGEYSVSASVTNAGSTQTIPLGTTVYDAKGRIIESEKTLLGGVVSLVQTTYDQLGRPVKVSKPYFSSPQFWTDTSFDVLNRPTRVTTPANEGDTSNSVVTNFTYSNFSTTVTQSAPNDPAETTVQVTDALGEMIEMVDANTGKAFYTYDPFGNLLTTTAPDNKVSSLFYDGLGHKTSMTDPDAGTWTYQVDALGEIVCQTDANNQSIIMTYDGIGRVTQKLATAQGGGCNATSSTPGTTTSSWAYDQAGALGLPAALSDSNGFQRSYAYDSLDRESDVTTTVSGTPYDVSTTYDNFGRVQTVAYPVTVAPTVKSTPVASAVVTTSPAIAGSPVNIDGSASTDPNGVQLQYQWTQTAGPELDSSAFNAAASAISFVPTVAGTYTFQLQVIDSNSSLSTPVSVSVGVRPVTPATPSVSNPNYAGTVVVNWNNTTGATTYRLYESNDGTTFTLVSTVNAASGNTTGASVGNLGDGTYYFEVAACGGGFCSPQGPVSGGATVLLPPKAPTGLGVSPGTSINGNFTLSWTAPATTTQYRIYRSTNGGSYVWVDTFNNSNSGTISRVEGGLADGSYTFEVAAWNAAGQGPNSASASGSVLHIPGTPGAASVNPTTVAGGDTFTLSWGKASGTVSYYIVNGGTTHYTGLSATLTAGDKAGTHYYYVQACNASGCGGDSASAALTDTGVSTGCPPPPYQCQLVMSDDRYAMKDVPVPNVKLVASTDLAPIVAVDRDLGSVLPLLKMAPEPIVPASVLAKLTDERQQLLIRQPEQRAESVLQAMAARRDTLKQPTLLPPAPSREVTAWAVQQAEQARLHPDAPAYAPPAYIAYSAARVESATSTPYRFTVQYSYDPSSGGLQAVSDANTGFIYWRIASGGGTAPVDAYGHLLGYIDGNNVSTVNSYDAGTGVITGISTGIGQSSSVQQLVYTWDGFGNLVQRCDVNKGLYENFTYADNQNRLTASTVYTQGAATQGSTPPCTGGTPGASIGMSYDAVGDIQSLSNSGNATVGGVYAYDPNHPHAVSTVANIAGTDSYDNNGNMVCRFGTWDGTNCVGGAKITWNTDNLPVQITAPAGSSGFMYGPDNQRYSQTAVDSSGNTTTTIYIGNLFEVVTNSGGTQYRHNIVASSGVVAVHTIDQTGNAQTNYIHIDHLGSADAMTADDGSVSQQMSFDAFGLRRDPANWSYDLTSVQIAGLKGITDRGYTYQEQLDNVGLIHMNGRVYDPSAARFVSPDPVMGGNRYSYVDDNPLGSTDPSGYCSVSIVGFSFGGGQDCGSQIVNDTPGLSNLGNALGDIGTDIADAGSHVGLAIQNNINTIIAAVVAYYTAGLCDGCDAYLAGAIGGSTYAATDTALNGGNGTQVFDNGLRGGIYGAAGGAITDGSQALFGNGWTSSIASGAANGYLQTGNLRGAVLGGISGAIPNDLDIQAYYTNPIANFAITEGVAFIRGGIITGSLKGAEQEAEYVAGTEVIGFGVGFLSEFVSGNADAPFFENGAWFFYGATVYDGRALTIGNVIISNGDMDLAQFMHEEDHATYQSALGRNYLPFSAVSVGMGQLTDFFMGGHEVGAFGEHAPFQACSYTTLFPDSGGPGSCPGN